MTVKYIKNNKPKRVKISNWLFTNRILFCIVKLVLVTKYFPFIRMRYKHFKPLIKALKSYKNYNIVNVKDHNGNIVDIYL